MGRRTNLHHRWEVFLYHSVHAFDLTMFVFFFCRTSWAQRREGRARGQRREGRPGCDGTKGRVGSGPGLQGGRTRREGSERESTSRGILRLSESLELQCTRVTLEGATSPNCHPCFSQPFCWRLRHLFSFTLALSHTRFVKCCFYKTNWCFPSLFE